MQVGTIMAASDRFNITVLGRGGHAGLPHKARDPVVAAAALVGALQVCSSRKPQRTILPVHSIEVNPSMLLCWCPDGGRHKQGVRLLTGLFRMHLQTFGTALWSQCFDVDTTHFPRSGHAPTSDGWLFNCRRWCLERRRQPMAPWWASHASTQVRT